MSIRGVFFHLSMSKLPSAEDQPGALPTTKKRKDRYADVAVTRRSLTEPERRKIAQGQGWRCINPDGGCLLPGELQEYDIDHVVPVWKGGQDETDNMQALCPACHRRNPES